MPLPVRTVGTAISKLPLERKAEKYPLWVYALCLKVGKNALRIEKRAEVAMELTRILQ